ncbi:DUF4258 domain-containing protein, partial [Chitiniphilus eburneus]
ASNPIHSFGRYTYANNNPLRYVDPDGRAAIVLEVGVPLLIAAIYVANNKDAQQSLIDAWNSIKGMMNSDPSPTTPTGSRGSPIEVEPGTNAPGTIGDRDYSGHAFDRMQGRGVPPSAVEEAIKNGESRPDRGEIVHNDTKNGVQVVVNQDGKVVTVKSIGKSGKKEKGETKGEDKGGGENKGGGGDKK